jgi:hypothetical protein
MPQLLLSFLNTGKWLLVLHLYYYFLLYNLSESVTPLLYYPEAYQRLQETVRSDPKLTLLESNTHFTIISNEPLKIVLGSWFNAPATFVIPKYW